MERKSSPLINKTGEKTWEIQKPDGSVSVVEVDQKSVDLMKKTCVDFNTVLTNLAKK